MSEKPRPDVSLEELAAAARPVIARVLTDAKGAPEPLGKALRKFAERLIEGSKTVAELERLCGLFADEPARAFAHRFGVTPRVYLTERRLEVAEPLLRTSPADVYRIGHAVGFSSPATFGTVFKTRYGTTPTAYRQAEPPAPRPSVLEEDIAQTLGEVTRRKPATDFANTELARDEPDGEEAVTTAPPLDQDHPTQTKEPPMIAKPLTHRDLATLFASADTAESSPMRQLLLAMVSHEPFAQMYRDIEQMADDAGISRRLEGWELDAVTDNQTFDRLMAASGWDDAAAVIDPRGETNVDYDTLLCICEARKARRAGDHARLEAVEHKLRAAAANERRQLERRREAETRFLESLAEHIREPEGVVVFTRLATELRNLLDQLERRMLAAAQQPSRAA